MKKGRAGADSTSMERKILWMCITFFSTVGGFVPELFGQSGFGVMAIFGTIAGIFAGVWVAKRISY
jgi:hypothetical protein